ncbi:unnamed protein product, partial [Brassica oleracea]
MRKRHGIYSIVKEHQSQLSEQNKTGGKIFVSNGASSAAENSHNTLLDNSLLHQSLSLLRQGKMIYVSPKWSRWDTLYCVDEWSSNEVRKQTTYQSGLAERILRIP